MKKLPLLLLSTLIAGSFSSAAMAEKKMMLKMPIYYNSVLPSLGSTAKYLADNVQTLSGNSLKIKLYEPNKLVNPKEILDAVSTGRYKLATLRQVIGAEKFPLPVYFLQYLLALKHLNI